MFAHIYVDMDLENFSELSIQELRLWCVSNLGSNRVYNLDRKMFIIENAHLMGEYPFSFKCGGHLGWTCINGMCKGTIDGTPFELNPRSTLIVLHDSEVGIEWSSADFLFHVTYMSQEFAQTIQIHNHFGVMMQIRNLPVYRLSEKQFSINMKYLDLMIESMQDEGNSYREQVLYRLQEAQYLTILRHLQQNEEEQNTHLSKTGDLATRFSTLLELDYMYHRDVAFYADRLCVTPKALSGNIKKISGLTAGQWIDRRITFAAKHLLGNSCLSVKDVSYALGFDDPSAFGKYFKRQVGINPRDYRTKQE